MAGKEVSALSPRLKLGDIKDTDASEGLRYFERIMMISQMLIDTCKYQCLCLIPLLPALPSAKWRWTHPSVGYTEHVSHLSGKSTQFYRLFLEPFRLVQLLACCSNSVYVNVACGPLLSAQTIVLELLPLPGLLLQLLHLSASSALQSSILIF